MANEHLVMEEDHMEKVYSSKNKLVSWLHNKRLDIIVEQVKGRSVMDYGCGEGQLLKKIHDKDKGCISTELNGMDCTKVALKRCLKRNPTIKRIICADIVSFKKLVNRFDCIICTEVIEHIPRWRDALKSMLRTLKPGGIFILTFPNEILWRLCRLALLRFPIIIPDHVNSFTPRMMLKNIQVMQTVELVRVITIPSASFPLTYIMVLKKNG